MTVTNICVEVENQDGTGESFTIDNFLKEFFKPTTKNGDDRPKVGETFINLSLKKAVIVTACFRHIPRPLEHRLSHRNPRGYKEVQHGLWVSYRFFGQPADSDRIVPLSKFHKEFQRPNTLKDYVWRRILGKTVIADVEEIKVELSGNLLVSYSDNERILEPGQFHEISIETFLARFEKLKRKQSSQES